MLQAVFLNAFKDLFLTESQDVTHHSLSVGLTGLNVFKVVLKWYHLSSSLFSSPLAFSSWLITYLAFHPDVSLLLGKLFRV